MSPFARQSSVCTIPIQELKGRWDHSPCGFDPRSISTWCHENLKSHNGS